MKDKNAITVSGLSAELLEELYDYAECWTDGNLSAAVRLILEEELLGEFDATEVPEDAPGFIRRWLS